MSWAMRTAHRLADDAVARSASHLPHEMVRVWARLANQRPASQLPVLQLTSQHPGP